MSSESIILNKERIAQNKLKKISALANRGLFTRVITENLAFAHPSLRQLGSEPHPIGEGLAPLQVMEAKKPFDYTFSRTVVTDVLQDNAPTHIAGALVQPGQQRTLTSSKGDLFIRFPFTPKSNERLIYAETPQARDENKDIFARMLPHMIRIFREDAFYAPRIENSFFVGSTNTRYFDFLVRHYNAGYLWDSPVNQIFDTEILMRGGHLDENTPFIIECGVFIDKADKFLANREP